MANNYEGSRIIRVKCPEYIAGLLLEKDGIVHDGLAITPDRTIIQKVIRPLFGKTYPEVQAYCAENNLECEILT